MTLFGFGKKKEKEINAPVCTCNGNCSVSETVEPENLNNCCQDIQGRICCIKVLGSGCASCHALYENTQSAVKAIPNAIFFARPPMIKKSRINAIGPMNVNS